MQNLITSSFHVLGSYIPGYSNHRLQDPVLRHYLSGRTHGLHCPVNGQLHSTLFLFERLFDRI